MRPQPTPFRTAHRRVGLTIAEVAVSTLLVGLVLVTSMKTVSGVIRTWQVTEQQHDGVALASDMMAEVMQARYFEPDEVEGSNGSPLGDILGNLKDSNYGRDDGESSLNRSAWDDTDDYDDWSASPPQVKDGTVLSQYTGWTRSVVVQKVENDDPTDIRDDNQSDKGLRRITVTVTAPDSTQTVLVGLRCLFGVMEQAPEEDSTFVIYVGSTLQVGAGGEAVCTGVNVTNHAEDQ